MRLLPNGHAATTTPHSGVIVMVVMMAGPRKHWFASQTLSVA